MLQYGQPGGEITIAADAKNAKPKKKMLNIKKNQNRFTAAPPMTEVKRPNFGPFFPLTA